MLILRGALANVSREEVSNEELLEYLSDNLSEAEIYKLTPRPGSIMGAAFDWQVILSNTASIIAVAQVIWGAYKKYILPRTNNEKKEFNSFLFIAIENRNKEFTQFAIGEKYNDEEEFTKEFVEQVNRIMMELDVDELEIEGNQIRTSDIWKKYK